jgi:dephospho-CoA kinase
LTVFIGLTGTFCSGKGTFIEIVKASFNSASFSTSDEVREETARKGMSLERQNLHVVANELRAQYGAGVFAERVVQKIGKLSEPKEVIVIDGLRTAGEISTLRKRFGKHFVMLGVEAPQELRYDRMRSRMRAGEHLDSFEVWRAFDDKESKLLAGDESKQNVARCLQECDFVLINDRTMDEFGVKVASLVSGLLEAQKRHRTFEFSLGLTGPHGAGKTTFMRICEEKYAALGMSLSDELREECIARRLPTDRETLIVLGNELRGKYGEGILAQGVVRKIQNWQNGLVIVDSIMNPKEVMMLKDGLRNFFLIKLSAPAEVRFQRIKARNRASERQLTFEQFKEVEERERIGKQSSDQDRQACEELADFEIENAETKEDLEASVEALFAKINERISKG